MRVAKRGEKKRKGIRDCGVDMVLYNRVLLSGCLIESNRAVKAA